MFPLCAIRLLLLQRGVLSDDGLVVLFTHPGDAPWTEVAREGAKIGGR